MVTDGLSNETNPSRHQKFGVAAVYVAAMFVTILDMTVVNVALPTIARSFTVPVDQTSTINIGFLVAVAIAMPVSGWLGNRFGARGVFLTAIGLFGAASAACGLATSLTELVAFRFLQGLAGGLMSPVGMAMLYRTFPPAQRVRLGRITTIPVAFAPALGPIVGGILTEHAGWRWIFYINVPIAALAVVFGLIMVRPLARTTVNRLDYTGFLLAGIGFAGLMYALSEGPSHGWTSAQILITGLGGFVLLGALVPVEMQIAKPMLQLRLLALRLFRSANLITMASSAGFLGALFAYPLMLQSALGYSPLQSGLMTFPEALGVMIGTQFAARYYSRVGPRWLVMGGQIVAAGVWIAIASVIDAATPLVIPPLLMFVVGLGQAHTFMPMQAAAFDTVPRRHTGDGTSLINIFRQAGSAMGVALAATVISAIGISVATQAGEIDLLPFQIALLACAGCNLIAAALAAFTIDNADAAPSRGLAPKNPPPEDLTSA